MPSRPESAVESVLDLRSLWQRVCPDGRPAPAIDHPWAARHRPDWAARGHIVWPRGGQWCQLQLSLACPEAWRPLGPQVARARLALRWWAEAAELWVQGGRVHQGDLFDTSCRWALPEEWWREGPWQVVLRLRSPLHDDGALVLSRLELEPLDPADPHGILAPTVAQLKALRQDMDFPAEALSAGQWQVLGHAHLDLAWLWPVADTWQAAERTFRSVLALMEQQPQLHFGHSTPALYAWLETHRPELHHRMREAMRQGRWEPLNGPWVECDCVLIGTPSLLRQFQEGQRYSQDAFPEWSHPVAWLPDSFGFSAGLPPVAAATGVRWFCTHKLAWNGSHPFPHRLFRWRGRCGREVLALMSAPIGTDGDPLAMERYRLAWQQASGVPHALWLPGVGDHGGGPTLEMLEQLALWQGREGVAPQEHGTLRAYLARLEPLAATLPVWRDELYLELHRGCATSRPDQKRHNRSLERLLREGETALALVAATGADLGTSPGPLVPPDWRPLLFQQFHDILPGTSIPEVFEQAEPIWRRARRRSRLQRDQALLQLLGSDGASSPRWTAYQLQCLPPQPRTLRLPQGPWHLPAGELLPSQRAAGGGDWVQLPGMDGVAALGLSRGASRTPSTAPPMPISHPVSCQRLGGEGEELRWRLNNGLLAVDLGRQGVEQLWDGQGRPQLAGPLRWCRYGDRGEFWDAWDLAATYRDHPLPWIWDGDLHWLEQGPLCAQMVWRGRCGESSIRLDGRLLAGSPWFELVLRLDWRQRHELLRLSVPLASRACRWAADTPGGVIERPAEPRTPREQTRWEVAAVSWMASVQTGSGSGLALLLDGPQGVSAGPEELGVSLVRGPTWPDPGADNGCQRLRLALMPAGAGWRHAAVPQQACRFREPLWLRPWSVSGPSLERAEFPSQEPDVQVVGLQRLGEGSAEVIVTLQNLGPSRRRLRLGHCWELVGQLDGLLQAVNSVLPSESEESLGGGLNQGALSPWSITFWRLRFNRRDHQRDR
ncbi:MAG: glycoside hydrolase family 38 C-terminal domain-containing protein [Cyanobacteriota bacterium]|nr:glycoside hydrolase family 38 C-terminal domain-containing protein [Cyanobacteriota bacterium]